MRDDDSAQMVLLGALLVLITYFGILAITSRIEAVAPRTAAQVAPDFVEESARVRSELDNLPGPYPPAPPPPPAGSATWEAALFLPVHEAQRGYAMVYLEAPTCTTGGPSPGYRAHFRLSDGDSEAAFVYTRLGAC